MLSDYFKGDGPQVLADFIRRYGRRRGTAMFYATANAKGMGPKRLRDVLKK